MMGTSTLLASAQESLLPRRYFTYGFSSHAKWGLIFFALALFVMMAPDAMAGGTTLDTDADATAEDPFLEIWGTLVGWTQGTLGRVIALTLIVVGATMGVVNQSLMTFVVGIAMGLALYNAPIIVNTVMGATVTDMPLAANDAVKLMLNNGLN